MTEAPTEATVLDTCTISNFAHVDRVDLLVDLPRVVTVDAVRTGLRNGVRTYPYLDAAVTALDTKISVVMPSVSARCVEETLLETVDPGEAQALAVADVTDGTIVTDDGDARSVAKRRDVEVTGSIGLLVRSVESDALSAETADKYLKRWIDEAGFRSPAREFDAFLDR